MRHGASPRLYWSAAPDPLLRSGSVRSMPDAVGLVEGVLLNRLGEAAAASMGDRPDFTAIAHGFVIVPCVPPAAGHLPGEAALSAPPPLAAPPAAGVAGPPRGDSTRLSRRSTSAPRNTSRSARGDWARGSRGDICPKRWTGAARPGSTQRARPLAKPLRCRAAVAYF